MKRYTYKEQQRRDNRLRSSGETFEILVAMDYRVEQLSEYHFRVNGKLDIWPSSRKYYDIKLGRKGEYVKLKDFVVEYFKQNLVTIG